MAQLFSSFLKSGLWKSEPLVTTSVRFVSKASKRKAYIYEFFKHDDKNRPSAQEAHKNLTIPRLPIHYTGSVYETSIKRKNEIRNPNLPLEGYWDSTKECLKWTDWRMKRDVNRRLAMAEYFPMRQNLVMVIRNHLLPDEIRHDAHKELYQFPVKSHPWTVTNRCAITSRGRGKFRMFRLSRIIFRHIADYNNMSGVMKAKWGP